MGERRTLVPFRMHGFLKPRDGVVQLALLDQIGADVVVGIAELGIPGNGAMTLLDRVVEPAHETIGPAEERVRFGRGMGRDGLSVERDGFFQFAFHLPLIGALKELPRFTLVFLAAFALY